MNIQGLQKTTLLDFPGKVAALVFLGGCNFRCPFCQNAEIIKDVPAPQVSENELFSFLQKRKGLLDGVVVTGGEPMLQPDLPDLLRKIKQLGYLVKLDTNGYFPNLLKTVMDEGLVDYVAMDVKNSKQSYAKTVGVEKLDVDRLDESIKLLMQGNVEYEFRTTLVDELHSDDDILEIGKWLCGAENLYLQSFVDSEYVAFSGLHAPEKEKIMQYQQILQKFVQNVKIRN